MLKKLLIAGMTLLAMTCFFVAAGCESKESKELREFKQQQIELFNQRIEETFAVQYDDSFPSPEYYEYYLSTIQKDTVEKIQNAATKEEAEKIMGDADSEIQIVSRYYNHYAQTIGFSVSNLENATEIAEYNDGSLHLSVGIFAVTSPLSSGGSYIAARVTLPEGISAKVYYSNGLTFLTPQTDATFSPDSYPGSNAEKATSPFTVSADDAEETYILLFDTTDPIIYDHKGGAPSYNKDHDFYFSIIFEKDGFVTGYCLYNYLDKTTYDFRAIKTVVYGENYRGRVSEEKALGYIDKAKQGEDGEAADGIEYAEMGKLYVADRKNLFVYSDYRTCMKTEDKNRYFEIAYENSPDKIRIVLPKDLSSFTLSAQTGEFTLKGVTAKTVTPGIGDVVIYKNDSGALDFISGVLQPALYNKGYATDSFIYNSFFCVFAVQPDGTAPYVPGTLAFKPLAVKYISFADGLADDSTKQKILKIFDIITRSAIEYHESEYRATL